MSTFEPEKFRLTERKLFQINRSIRATGYLLLDANNPSKDEEKARLLFQKGCLRIVKETYKASSIGKERPKLKKIISQIKKGEELICNEITDLGGNEIDIINNIYYILKKGINIKTLDGIVYEGGMESSFLSSIALLRGLLKINKPSFKINKNSINKGGRPKVSRDKVNFVINLRSQNYSYRSIHNQTGLALSTIRRIILENP
tara:strand:- start:1026 stop:1634 length:609 start_codon:yes stop_codon:yes gene_type:complete